MFLQQLVNGITIGSMYALVAIGYSMIFSVLRLINFFQRLDVYARRLRDVDAVSAIPGKVYACTYLRSFDRGSGWLQHRLLCSASTAQEEVDKNGIFDEHIRYWHFYR